MPDVPDAKVYLVGAAAIFDEYPPEVGDMLADPRTGTRLLKPYPWMHDIRDACDKAYEPIGRQIERDRADESHRLALAAPAKPDEQRRAEQIDDYEKRVKPALTASLKAMPSVPDIYQRPDDGKHLERVASDLARRRKPDAQSTAA